MPAPNPVLGLHVSPGAVAWARVQRRDDGSYHVAEHGIETAPDDPTAAVETAAKFATRRPWRGRGTFLAFPDASGCLVPARLPPEELDLAGDDLHRELHEHTRFEPDTAALRFRMTRIEARCRDFQVAALPAAQERRFRDASLSADDGTVGYGFAGASLARGARALGIAGPASFLVEIQPRVTLVYAFDDLLVRRFLLPSGRDDVLERAAKATSRDVADVADAVAKGTVDATLQDAIVAAAEDLGADVKDVAAYQIAQRFAPKDPPADLPPPVFVGAGPLLASRALRRALGVHLGPAFVARPPLSEPGERITWESDPGDALGDFAGAVGAAVEAFQRPEDRLALVPPPADVPEVASRPRWLVPAAVAVAAAIAVGAWFLRPEPSDDGAAAARASSPLEKAHAEGVRALRLAAWIEAVASATSLVESGIADVRDVTIVPGTAAPRGTAAYGIAVTFTAAPTAVEAVSQKLRTFGTSTALPGFSVVAKDGSIEARWRTPSLELRIDKARPVDDAELLRAAVERWTHVVVARRDVECAGGRAPDPRPKDGGESWQSDDALAALACLAADDAPGLHAASVRATPDGVRVEWKLAEVAPVEEPPLVWRSAAEVAARLTAPIPSGRIVAPESVLAELTLAVRTDGRLVRLSWPEGGDRVLRRREPGTDGWIVVADVPAGRGEATDEPEGPAGTYRWRLDERATVRRPRLGRDVTADLGPSATCELLGRAADGSARFRLTRTWRGAAVVAEVTVAAGGRIEGAAAADGASRPLALDTGLVLVGLRETAGTATASVPLPDYLPDGTVLRGPDGSPQLAPRPADVPVRTLHADVRAGSEGAVRTVSRKMTDG